jgi:hypothetical protein
MSTLAVNSVTDANGGNTATINSMTPTADSLQGFRNRIINGDMRIAQRGTAAVTAADSYPVDRFTVINTTDGAFSAQQDSDTPAGFVNSVKITTTTADATLTTTQSLALLQNIEGFNTADLAFGSASAKTVTLSFWVRSSLTGTFGGALRNGSANRSYPFTYSISSADTWEYKTITIPGETSGTWLTTNGRGVQVFFGLGAGPDRSGTAGAWNTNNNLSATGAVSVIGTLNATWYVTGVQLEVGSVATPFERRPYTTELQLCQRYYNKTYANSVVPGTSAINGGAVGGQSTGNLYRPIPYRAFPVEMRATPSVTLYSPITGTSGKVRNDNTGADLDGVVYNVGTTGTRFYPSATPTLGDDIFAHIVASAEL